MDPLGATECLWVFLKGGNHEVGHDVVIGYGCRGLYVLIQELRKQRLTGRTKILP